MYVWVKTGSDSPRTKRSHVLLHAASLAEAGLELYVWKEGLAVGSKGEHAPHEVPSGS